METTKKKQLEMKTTLTYLYALLSVVSLMLVGCKEETDALETFSAELKIEYPENIQNPQIKSGVIRGRNVTTGAIDTFDIKKGINLISGLYDFELSADVSLPSQNDTVVQLKAFTQSVVVNSSNSTIKFKAFESYPNDDLIISEIFFTGTLQNSGSQYHGDDYVKIYNNTDHVIYADGLTLFESKFLTTQKFDYKPDIMSEAMTVDALYTIPGSGKEHPVYPGEYLLLVDTGIDHRVANPNSFDLSKADFEWYDISTSPKHQDIDGPEVPNLDKWYCYTLSFWLLHNRGFKAYGLARIPIDKEKYLKEYKYTYRYVQVLPSGTYNMELTAYKLPNEWIKDLVTGSVKSEYVWNVSAPTLDRGWTHCGTMNSDPTRYFKSVRRKMLYLKANGKPFLKDTNNSTDDFNPDCVPSEIEQQGTATDIYGTPATVRTYDGVVPMK